MTSNKQSLFAGTVILLFSNIIVKGLGFFYRIFLVRRLGTEAMGLIELISPVYSVFLVLAGWGISLALSTKIAEKSTDGDIASCSQYIAAGRQLMRLFGLTATVIAFLSFPLIMHFIPDRRSGIALLTLLPAILFVNAASSYRGIFQGVRRISELGNAQMLEQFMRVITGIALTFLLTGQKSEIRIIAVSVATLVGEAAGFFFIRHRYQKQKISLFGAELPFRDIKKPYRRELLQFGTPVTVTRLVASLAGMMQALIIPAALLQSGLATQEATAAYGTFMSVSVSLLHMPGIFTAALAVSVIPAVAESSAELLQQRVNKAMAATILFTLPGMILLHFFAEPLCSLLFHAPNGAEALKILTLGGIFMHISITVSGVLQGMGKVGELLRNNIISGIVLIINLYLFTKIPRWGTAGTAWAFNIDFLFSCLLDYRSLRKYSDMRFDLKNIIFKPLTAALLMSSALLLNAEKLTQLTAHPLALSIAVMLAVVIYALGVFIFECFIRRNEL